MDTPADDDALGAVEEGKAEAAAPAWGASAGAELLDRISHLLPNFAGSPEFPVRIARIGIQDPDIDIRARSAVEVQRPNMYHPANRTGFGNGPMSPAMGAEGTSVCAFCGEPPSSGKCVGHQGHIELSTHGTQMLAFSSAGLWLLRCTCVACGESRLPCLTNAAFASLCQALPVQRLSVAAKLCAADTCRKWPCWNPACQLPVQPKLTLPKPPLSVAMKWDLEGRPPAPEYATLQRPWTNRVVQQLMQRALSVPYAAQLRQFLGLAHDFKGTKVIVDVNAVPPIRGRQSMIGGGKDRRNPHPTSTRIQNVATSNAQRTLIMREQARAAEQYQQLLKAHGMQAAEVDAALQLADGSAAKYLEMQEDAQRRARMQLRRRHQQQQVQQQQPVQQQQQQLVRSPSDSAAELEGSMNLPVDLVRAKQAVDATAAATLKMHVPDRTSTVVLALTSSTPMYKFSVRPRPGQQGSAEPQGCLKSAAGKKSIGRAFVGGRTNWSFRAVLVPAPLSTPFNALVIAAWYMVRLTEPHRITPWSLRFLLDAVVAGPQVYGGAGKVVLPDGTELSLRNYSLRDRVALARRITEETASGTRREVWVVRRHLQDNAVVLYNRAPNIQQSNATAPRALVCRNPDGSIARHAKDVEPPHITTAQNHADYDGDAANLHAVQETGARAEAAFTLPPDQFLKSPETGNMLVVPTLNAPMALYELSHPDTTVTPDVFHVLQTAAAAHFPHLATVRVPPDVTDPTGVLPPRYSGRLALAMMLPADLNSDPRPGAPFQVRNGRLVSPGPVTVSAFLGGQHAVSHTILRDHGNEVAGRFISGINHMLNAYADLRGWSCGLDELVQDVRDHAAMLDMRVRVNRHVDRAMQLYTHRGWSYADASSLAYAALSSVTGTAQTLVTRHLPPSCRLLRMAQHGTIGQSPAPLAALRVSVGLVVVGTSAVFPLLSPSQQPMWQIRPGCPRGMHDEVRTRAAWNPYMSVYTGAAPDPAFGGRLRGGIPGQFAADLLKLAVPSAQAVSVSACGITGLGATQNEMSNASLHTQVRTPGPVPAVVSKVFTTGQPIVGQFVYGGNGLHPLHGTFRPVDGSSAAKLPADMVPSGNVKHWHNLMVAHMQRLERAISRRRIQNRGMTLGFDVPSGLARLITHAQHAAAASGASNIGPHAAGLGPAHVQPISIDQYLDTVAAYALGPLLKMHREPWGAGMLAHVVHVLWWAAPWTWSGCASGGGIGPDVLWVDRDALRDECRRWLALLKHGYIPVGAAPHTSAAFAVPGALQQLALDCFRPGQVSSGVAAVNATSDLRYLQSGGASKTKKVAPYTYLVFPKQHPGGGAAGGVGAAGVAAAVTDAGGPPQQSPALAWLRKFHAVYLSEVLVGSPQRVDARDDTPEALAVAAVLAAHPVPPRIHQCWQAVILQLRPGSVSYRSAANTLRRTLAKLVRMKPEAMPVFVPPSMPDRVYIVPGILWLDIAAALDAATSRRKRHRTPDLEAVVHPTEPDVPSWVPEKVMEKLVAWLVSPAVRVRGSKGIRADPPMPTTVPQWCAANLSADHECVRVCGSIPVRRVCDWADVCPGLDPRHVVWSDLLFTWRNLGVCATQELLGRRLEARVLGSVHPAHWLLMAALVCASGAPSSVLLSSRTDPQDWLIMCSQYQPYRLMINSAIRGTEDHMNASALVVGQKFCHGTNAYGVHFHGLKPPRPDRFAHASSVTDPRTPAPAEQADVDMDMDTAPTVPSDVVCVAPLTAGVTGAQLAADKPLNRAIHATLDHVATPSAEASRFVPAGALVAATVASHHTPASHTRR